MATFSGNAAGYRVDLLDNGKVRVTDINASDGDTGRQIVARDDDALIFDDRSYGLAIDREMQVSNTHLNTLFPSSSHVSVLADGGYVVTWYGSGEGANEDCIYIQRYDAASNPMGGETRVNTTTLDNRVADNMMAPGITALEDGGYVITWTYEVNSHAYNIYAQRYDAAGDAVGGEIQVSTTKSVWHDNSVATALAGGGYIIAWVTTHDGSASGIRSQRFDAAGHTVGGETIVSESTNSGICAITTLTNGGYVLTWSVPDGATSAIHARCYDANGNALGDEALVNSTDAGEQYGPDITALSDGGYLITWTSGGQDGSGYGIYSQRYDAAGSAVGGETRVNTITAGDQVSSDVTGLDDGGYIVAWRSSAYIHAQRYDADGNAVGGEITLNGSIPAQRSHPDIVALDDGGYLVTWTSTGKLGSYDAIYASRFDANGDMVGATGVVLTGTADADAMNGGAGLQVFYGGDGNDTLTGGGGDDFLYGQNGIDVLSGQAGDDYLNAGDNYKSAGDKGDTLKGGAGNDVLIGGYSNDTLIGGAGNDGLGGGGGRDTLNGGKGNDYLYGYAHGDILNGGKGDDVILGGRGQDVLRGGAGDDLLDGEQDGDVFYGGLGNDVLRGGTDSFDVYCFDTKIAGGGNVDTLRYFKLSDVIRLDNDIFGKLATPGVLDAGNFSANADGAAMDADDYILYETDTGKLFYDADGNGAAERIQFAVIGDLRVTALTAADFQVV